MFKFIFTSSDLATSMVKQALAFVMFIALSGYVYSVIYFGFILSTFIFINPLALYIIILFAINENDKRKTKEII